ncbi:2-oxoglutarate dehydrogenase E1 component [Thiohalobacter thiocyanaticus]|uniref:2-oxoglutarate dehydrogenase E1 component n=1 Tax=Thiohalobacter thiocyanaticus TaxID=585455 RepID=A0A426QFM6_9GAMM|nr:2-oxoglutarate dehydrogenase E1 component [Thiohalobacter thiocyanaticus]RRQ20547.1 2-oxoglutarate dehydrogenase E1 component [Thiohalobacter thiocyanaticus]
MQQLWADSQLTGHNAAYLDELYDRYLEDPAQVEEHWRTFFDMLPTVDPARREDSHTAIREQFRTLTRRPAGRSGPAPTATASHEEKQIRVLQLINAYRFRAHQIADIDPLGLRERPDIPELKPAHHGLTDADLDLVFDTGSLAGVERTSLSEILDLLDCTYAGHIGVEYMHITETGEKRWLQQRLESCAGPPRFAEETRLRILDRLTAAEGLERYLHNRYVGQKRFSLEGGDSLIPILDELIQRGGVHGVKELVIGMAHRGRLNVLVNIMGKTPAELFQEFEGKAGRESSGSGDVKYHLGFSSDIQTQGGPVHINLAFNPSHLEIADPVVEGSVRARQDRRNDTEGASVVPVLIHGDAAFAGQGVVMETFNMSQSRGYSTKGTVHLVINNQIGFTTSYQRDARSTQYCTDIAKMVNAPILHVNGDDPEAVLFVTQIALDYRMTYHKDVVIDLVCYRRHGHSEADEPTATQPLMYHSIKQKPSARSLYAQLLVEAGLIDAQTPERLLEEYRDALDAGRSVVKELIPAEQSPYPHAVDWKPYIGRSCTADVHTAIDAARLKRLWQGLSSLPEGFEIHPNVGKIMENRRKMTAGALAIDWGYAETMAYASLVTEGYPVRLSGQDSGRGTFFHRHAVLSNQVDGTPYVPLRNIAPDQANFLVINSLLSEEAVLAFEYGYATTDPGTLVIWEAQFGDFANNAQVVIDQFISAGEQKWNRLCGLVMFLPHGYEGQGPEHSSARLERYLQLCAEQNMQVCVPTTPAQIFHLLRQQMLNTCRKPLVVMTPKSLLRHRLAVSRLEDLTAGNFHAVIPEVDELDPGAVNRVILCSGKVYYELLEKRREVGLDDVAIIRLERLYPFPETILRQTLEQYPNVETYIWCQEEPRNQGAWYSTQHHLYAALPCDSPLEYVGRPFSAAPAVGYNWLHVQQQHRLVAEALGLEASG